MTRVAKRGFLAEVNYQMKQAEKRNRQREREAERAQTAARREREKAIKEAERARVAATRAEAAAQKVADKAAKEAHLVMMQAEVEARNSELSAHYDEIDSILEATLDVDDYVDLDALRTKAEHPPFPRPDLLEPTAVPAPLQLPPEPRYVQPERPSGIGAVLGADKRHAKAIQAAQDEFAQQHQQWQQHVQQLTAAHQSATQQYQASEAQRLQWVAQVQADHEVECRRLDDEAAQANASIDALETGLADGDKAAVDEYIGIVLANSVYPDDFEIEHAYEFDAELGEATITAWVPGPTAIRTEKEFKYVKARDEITATQLSKKAQTDRYASAIHQVALRTLHEVFEADRREIIQTISLTVATEGISPATGLAEPVALVAVAAERDSFLQIDLANVTPAATLEHLGAQISKKPAELAGIDTSEGVRSL